MQVKFSFYLSSVPDNIHAIKFIWRHFKILLFNYLRINSLVHKSLLKYYYLWRELENCEHQKYFCNVIVLQEESQSGI